ncbi:MAG: flagellar hook-basal body complex protein FliE, partial [Syntrophomonas sp.]
MKTEALLSGVKTSPGLDSAGGAGLTEEPGQGLSFSDYLSQALDDVQTLQNDAQASAALTAMGQESYIHNTMLTYEKANLALQLTIQVRDKIVEAFQEIM